MARLTVEDCLDMLQTGLSWYLLPPNEHVSWQWVQSH